MSDTITLTTTPLPPPVEKKKKEFIGYIHSFRGFAIITVAAAHLLVDWPENSIVHDVIKTFWENGTVMFMFMAGYLFHYLAGKFNFREYLLSKMKFVVLPYIIISIPIIVYRLVTDDVPGYLLANQPDFLNWSVLRKLGYMYITGAHMQQFWFIPMIVLFYFLAPLFLYMDKHPKWYWVILPLMALAIYVGREPFSDIPRMFVHFIPCYLLGMCMSHYRIQYLEFAKKNWVLITSVTLLVLGVNFVYFTEFNAPLNFLHKMLFCPFFIYWFWRLDKYVPSFLSTLAYLSFGIYFVHYYVLLVIKAVYEKIMHQPIPGNLVYWTIYLILVLGGSILFIRVMQRIFGKNSKYLIGC